MQHKEECEALGVPFRDIDDLTKDAKDRTLMKKWARKWDIIFVSSNINKKVIRLIGKALTSVRKLPVQIGEKETVEAKIAEMKKTIRFRTQKCSWMGTSIGIETQSQEEIRQNIVKGLNFLVAQLPKGWLNIKTIHLKTTMMGKAIRID